MKRLLMIALTIFGSVASAQEVTLQFEQGNQLYRIGDYQQAAAFYEKIVGNGYESPALFYNLGNAYFKLKNIPGAILNYERALLLAPHDDDIAYNLSLANLRIIDRIEPIPQLFFVEWWHLFVAMFSATTWATVAVMFLWCGAVSGTIFLFVRQSIVRRFSFFIALICVLIFLTSSLSMVEQNQHEQTDQAAIVFAPSVSVKSSPDAQSTDLFVLHEGVKVELLDTVGDWKKIRLADGKVGWVRSDTIQII